MKRALLHLNISVCFFPVWLLRYEAAGLDTPAAAAAGVASSCCQAFLKRSILPLENWNWGTSVVKNAPLFLKSMPFVREKKLYKRIHSSIFHTRFVPNSNNNRGLLEPLPGVVGRRQGDTLVKSPERCGPAMNRCGSI